MEPDNEEYTCSNCGSIVSLEGDALVCAECGWRDDDPEYAGDIDDEDCDEDDEDFDNEEEDDDDEGELDDDDHDYF